ncbi:Transmembrane protein, partial [Phytophthora palmivora]
LRWILRWRIRDSLMHSSVEKHELFVQGKELEFMLGTSDTYLELYMPQFASFRRQSVEMPVHMCLMKLMLMFVFSMLRSPSPSMKNQGVQGSLFFFIVVSMAVIRTWRYPYRCVSTSYLTILVDWMLVANGVFVLLCANGVRSALTVSTSVTSSLTFLNLCFIVVIGIMELRDAVLFHLHPKAVASRRLCWPTNEHMKEIVDYGPKVASWVKGIRNAQSAILASLLVIPSMRSCEELKTALDQVELCYEEAAGMEHLLMGQLYEVSMYTHELYVEAVASSPFHRSGFPAKEFVDFSGVLQRRKDRQLLFSTRSQRILKRLQIARSWSRRARPYISTSVGWRQKCGVPDIHRFLDEESNLHQDTSLVTAMDWKSVNSVFCLKYHDGNDSGMIVSVVAWSESLGLVRWCAMKENLLPEENPLEQYFSLANARQSGIHGELVSCGEVDSTTALLHALSTPLIHSTPM